MKDRLAVFFIAAGILLSGIQLYGHHSFAATYFEDKQQTIEGDLVQLIFRNPHSYVHVDVKDDKGGTVQYAVEWGGGGQLGNQGVTRDTLKPGDHLVIVGNPSRNLEDHRLRMVRLRRTSDGYTWGTKPDEKVE